ncbi:MULTISPECIES: cupin domain-containing protein [Bacillus]|uniref:Cupin n=2 Tax=Bacillus TaxID=1386 RepID=A0A0M4FVQ8_9BACI|nr:MULTISPECIES: cupin domain-containing protein [Bacillus]ALC82718.1 cupin [Bacillus gobiensis]MBP1081670.1 mannose-6-phosphate isomerase-like protein (cupin superfamily) [Bacillus capparidis]MED1096323.1 cupin domain-containing protein [Bacillus capparidis]
MKITKQTAEHYNWGDNCDGWHLVKTKHLSVIHERMPAHTEEERHYRSAARQFFLVLSGSAVLEVDGERITIHSQEGVEVPPQVPPQMMNESDTDVEFIVISQPESRGDRVIAQSI